MPYVLGALSQLVLQTTWQGDPDDILLAQGRSTNLLGMFSTPACDAIVPAPYWDDTNGDDSDDELPESEQDWYGVWDGETFVEALSYWAVTAFLATGVSEGAAIEFITPLRTFRLTLKANEHGAKLLVFMDSNIFQLVDLFSPTDALVQVDIVSPGSTLMLVHSGEHNPSATPNGDGDYEVNIIRKELTEAEVSPPNQRIDPDTNIFQITVDGGDHWNNAECSDPRTSDAYLLPPLEPYDGIECDVAARMVAQFQDTLAIFIESGDAAQFATEVLALAAATVPLVGWLVDLLIIVGNVLVDIGQSNIEDAFTSTVYDDMRCAFFCQVNSDGQLSQEQLNKAYDDLSALHPGTVANVIDELRLFYGDVAMNNAGVVRDETGTCDECICLFWPRQFDFCGTLDGWTITCGTLTANGIQSVNSCEGSPSIIYIRKTIAVPSGSAITEVRWWVSGTFSTGDIADLYWNGTLVSATTNPAGTTPYTTNGFSLTGTAEMLIIWQRGSTGSDERIPTVQLFGTGTPPDVGHDEILPIPCA